MNTYEVWVAAADGTGRIVLLEGGSDGNAASQLVSALVGYASGASLSIGVTITHSTTPPAPAPAPARHGAPPAAPAARK